MVVLRIGVLFFCFLAGLSGIAAGNNLRSNPLYHVGTRTLNADGKTLEYGDTYLDLIQPILGARCVACHGCFEAPCQLNLQAYEGLRRGFKAEPIYSKKRLRASYPTRMIDAESIAEWRKMEFHPVVDSMELKETESDDFKSSVMYQLVAQGEKINKNGFAANRLNGFQTWMNENQRQVCVASDKQFDAHFKSKKQNPWGVVSISEYLKNWPVAGMPFGLPVPLESAELKAWMESGAIGPSPEAQSKLEQVANAGEIQRWEDFLNVRTNKGLHTGRYIYEHVFSAHINFKSNPGEFFVLVRSRSQKGKIDQIVTELPYEDPEGEVFYRFKKITHNIVHKTHFVWELDDTRLGRLKKLFVDDWQVDEAVVPAPKYVTRKGYVNSNPFEIFEPIPAMSRARFMIENSRIIVGAMTQGSVCVGTTATFAINDHFWTWFLKPESDVSAMFPKLGLDNWDTLATGNIDGAGLAAHFDRTVKDHAKYEEAYERQLRLWLKSRPVKGLAVTDLWDGSGDPNYPNGNPNAWLNITRHEKSATVQYGPEGGSPHSIWVMSYSNFERLYYNLVASFREWGSADHKAATWRHMSYVRIEGEDLAISFLPIKYRKEVRDRFARGFSYWRNKPYPQYSTMGLDDHQHLTKHLHRADLPPRPEGTPNIGDTADEAIGFLVTEVRGALKPGVKNTSVVSLGEVRKDFERQLNFYQDQSRRNPGNAYSRAFTNVSYLRVEGEQGEAWVYTLVANRSYRGHNDMFVQTRSPEFDTFSVYRGFVGGYPNVFFDVKKEKRREFIVDISKVGSSMTWDAFRQKWGVARNSAHFWPFFDEIHAQKMVAQPGINPVEQGIADLSQYEIFEE